MNDLLTFPQDAFGPNADYETNLKQFKLAVTTLINTDFITKREYFNIVGQNFGMLYDAYYILNTEDKQKLELSDLQEWNELYVEQFNLKGETK